MTESRLRPQTTTAEHFLSEEKALHTQRGCHTRTWKEPKSHRTQRFLFLPAGRREEESSCVPHRGQASGVLSCKKHQRSSTEPLESLHCWFHLQVWQLAPGHTARIQPHSGPNLQVPIFDTQALTNKPRAVDTAPVPKGLPSRPAPGDQPWPSLCPPGPAQNLTPWSCNTPTDKQGLQIRMAPRRLCLTAETRHISPDTGGRAGEEAQGPSVCAG